MAYQMGRGFTGDRDASGGKRIEQANKKDENVMEIQTWIHCGDRVQVRLICGTSNEGGWGGR